MKYGKKIDRERERERERERDRREGAACRSGLRLTRNVEVVNSSPIKETLPYCLVLVASRNGFNRAFTIELKEIEGLIMEG